MTLVRRIARPLLAAQFIYGGLDQVRHPERKTDGSGPVIPALAGTSIGPVTLPSDPEGLVRVNGAIMTGAGSLLAIGRLPRLSSLVLAASLVPTTLQGHRFWQESDPEKKQLQIAQTLKNAAIFGGLLVAAVDTEGKPGLRWRAQHAARDTRRAAKAAKVSTKAATASVLASSAASGKKSKKGSKRS